MSQTTIQFDADAEAVYIRFSTAEVFETVEISQTLYIDVDEQGNPIGIEVLGVDSSTLSNLPRVPNEAELRQLLRN
jgi:uncharacterized protein YuzE